jgi:hypothetical protein
MDVPSAIRYHTVAEGFVPAAQALEVMTAATWLGWEPGHLHP